MPKIKRNTDTPAKKKQWAVIDAAAARAPKTQEEAAEDATKLPPSIEADIAARWSDNVVAAQLTRTVARALLRQNRTEDEIRTSIMTAGREVY